jgi:hypothetical protein
VIDVKAHFEGAGSRRGTSLTRCHKRVQTPAASLYGSCRAFSNSLRLIPRRRDRGTGDALGAPLGRALELWKLAFVDRDARRYNVHRPEAVKDGGIWVEWIFRAEILTRAFSAKGIVVLADRHRATVHTAAG